MVPAADRIAISAMGCVSAAGRNPEEHLRSLNGRPVPCGPVPAETFATSLTFPVFSAPDEPLPSPTPDYPRLGQIAADLGPTARLALRAALQALVRSGIEPADLRKKRVGICLGTTVGCAFNDEDYYRAWRQGAHPPLDPVRRYLRNNISAILQEILGVSGPSLVVTNACASGTDALGIAGNWLRSGRCDLAIAGGADALSRITCNGFAALQLTDSAPCRPFNQNRQGLNLGEGAAVLILENESSAHRARRRPIGWLRGYGCAADAWHPTAPHPEGRGLQAAITAALKDAMIPNRKQIAMINGHGTATPSNDLAETSALAAIFTLDYRPPLISTKSLTGHTLGAAGAIEAVFTLLALQNETVSGTRRCRQPDPAFPYRPLTENEQVPLTGRIGLSQSLAFGGGNSCLVLEAAP
ncbi:MAG TPA: beta-ketoacyl-[acyl-carrier-protein] synthase family protein [Desulfurivibrio alkaliphilus]|uniref:Beta-ketoacyl-[acyl-carrier-protein] synthase family protein n=1 Tax=Desulfurivibrio alkaliphilus TaxID=427923 RepID=A0A7C2XVU7_9BACT|nr:beta-ketoacyl-[acyl-carrier-protein] synthase family protein [Desulfurivibrio alkaliphilus]